MFTTVAYRVWRDLPRAMRDLTEHDTSQDTTASVYTCSTVRSDYLQRGMYLLSQYVATWCQLARSRLQQPCKGFCTSVATTFKQLHFTGKDTLMLVQVSSLQLATS